MKNTPLPRQSVCIMRKIALWRADTRMHAPKPLFWVSYTSPDGYRKISFDSLWASLKYWWQLRHHPHYKNVRWEVTKG